MKRYSKIFIITGLLLLVWSCQQQTVSTDPPSIRYQVSMEDPSNHYFKVQLDISNWNADSLILRMPVWTPGYYMILDLQKHVVDFTATDGEGELLTVRKSDKNAWTIATNKTTQISASWWVFANKRSVAEPLLDTVKAFISPTGIFMYPEGYPDPDIRVKIHPYKEWSTVSTGLSSVPGESNTYSATDFDELYDCPIVVGNFTRKTFEVEGIPHEIAIERVENTDLELLTQQLTRIVETGKSIIGEFPYDHYSFLIMENGMGGLEHRNSMAVYSNIANYPGNRSQIGWLGFIAHEYFHLYNVKTIRPIALGPFDYNSENLTNMLWVSEGGTVYYQEIILNRAGFTNAQQFLNTMANTISGIDNRSGQLFQSATQSSWDTWINFFSRSDNSREVTISYYDKGAVLCMILDLAIRYESNNKKSLDDVMRTLYYDYHKDKNRGFTDQEFRKECEKAAGSELSELFEELIPTTRAIPYSKYLSYAGLQIDTTPIGQPVTYLGKTFIPRKWAITKLDVVTDEQNEIFQKWLKE